MKKFKVYFFLGTPETVYARNKEEIYDMFIGVLRVIELE
jgi:hypothetical protein